MAERKALYRRALELAFLDSPRIFVVDQSILPASPCEIAVTSDLAGGVSGTGLWPALSERQRNRRNHHLWFTASLG